MRPSPDATNAAGATKGESRLAISLNRQRQFISWSLRCAKPPPDDRRDSKWLLLELRRQEQGGADGTSLDHIGRTGTQRWPDTLMSWGRRGQGSADSTALIMSS